MKYLCTSCNYVFDEALWDIWEDIIAWTKIENIEKCPVCEEYDTFHHINEEINYIDDNDLDYMEASHYIDLKHIDFQFKIIVWNDVHPMWGDHRIAWIALFDEYGDLVEEKFLKEDEETIIYFDDYDLDIFEIRLKCTQHKIFAKRFEL